MSLFFLVQNIAHTSPKVHDVRHRPPPSTDKKTGITDILSAGYLYKDRDKYKLIPAKEVNIKSFFTVNEISIKGPNLWNMKFDKKNIKFMYNNEIVALAKSFESGLEKAKDDKNEIEKINKAFASKRNNRNYCSKYYKPYQQEISFS